MTETPTPPAPSTDPVATTNTPPSAYGDRERNRRSGLYAVAAWVGIVAGVVFIVAVIFFTGFALGAHAGHRYGGGEGRYKHHRDSAMMEHGRQDMMPQFGPDRMFILPPEKSLAPSTPTTTTTP